MEDLSTLIGDLIRIKEQSSIQESALIEQNRALIEQNRALIEQNRALIEQNRALTTEPKLESAEPKLESAEPKLESAEPKLESAEQVSTNVPLSSVESQEITLSTSDGDGDDCNDGYDDNKQSPITCSVYDGTVCISSTGELAYMGNIFSTVVSKHESLAFAEETTEDEKNKYSSIVEDCFTTVLFTDETDETIFEPIYSTYTNDAQEDESYKDDPMYHGRYDRTASRYVIPYSLLLSFLEDDTTKSFLLHDIPEMFENTLISKDIICSKL